MRKYAIAALGALSVAACSGRYETTADSAAAPEVKIAETGAAAAPGLQRLKGHLTPAILQAPRLGRVEPSTTLTLTVGLAVKDMGALQDAARAVADPQSPSFREYLTPDQFADRFGATKADYQAVLDWARSKNLAVDPQPNRLAVNVSGAVADIESALHVALRYRERPDGTRFFAPDAEPAVDLAVPIERIGGLQNFLLPQRAAGSGSGGSYQGTDFRHAYAPCDALTGAGQTVGIFMSDGFLQSDINAYAQQTGQSFLPVQAVPAGSGTNSNGSAEGTLDIDMVLSMAPAAQVVVFTGSTAQTLTAMAARPDIKQFSSSWAFYDVGSFEASLLTQLEIQGQSFLEISGDFGAYGPGWYPAGVGAGNLDIRETPYVTLVGGTSLNMANNGASYGSLETVWSAGYGAVGSGGIEPSVPIPFYQTSIAGQNFASSTSRNAPDVSAQAAGGNIVYNGSVAGISGTSQATPLWAGFMALVNQAAATAGLPSVGWANPTLYAIAGSKQLYANTFHDVVVGCNPNPNNFQYCAGKGYDLTTGLGSPQCGLIPALTKPGFGVTQPSSAIILTGAPGWDTIPMAFPNRATTSGNGWWNPSNDYVPDFGSWSSTAGAQQLTGDFNGDGLTDIALAGPASWDTIPVAFSKGDGNWTPTNDYVADFGGWSSTAGVQRLVGDFNGDGKADIALTGPSAWDTIPLAFSHGDGSWTPTNVYVPTFPALSARTSARRLAGDFNGDGKTDIALVGVSGWTTIPLVLSNGDGSWTLLDSTVPSFPSQSAMTGAEPIVGDFNGDGYADIALTGGTILGQTPWDTIPVAFSNGDGTWTATNLAVPNFGSWSATPGVERIVGDFDGDGKADLALVNLPGFNSIPVACSNGDGTFRILNSVAPTFQFWAGEAGVVPIAGDFDYDGLMDIALTGNPSWDTVPVAFSIAGGNWNVFDNAVANFPAWASTPGAVKLGGRE